MDVDQPQRKQRIVGFLDQNERGLKLNLSKSNPSTLVLLAQGCFPLFPFNPDLSLEIVMTNPGLMSALLADGFIIHYNLVASPYIGIKY